MKRTACALFTFLFCTTLYAAPLELQKGEHICIIGNTLADRMQHDGWLETLIQARFPKHELVFRDLGFSGDELNQRIRSQAFGTPDQWLAGVAPVPEPSKLVTRLGVRENRFETTNTKADVVFAFFGYNESWAGEAGLEAFKTDLAAFIKNTLAQKYNGKSAPKLVIFSPIAFEDHKSPNLPDGKDTNVRLKLYTEAMREVAKAKGVHFVDLFTPTQDLYAKAKQPLTINGVHLNAAGNQEIAKIIDQTLFGATINAPGEKQIAALRDAVVDKNFYWFNRYRVMDGYNIYGGRAFIPYANKQSNYEDQQRELEILDVKTSNRDKRIWAVAQGGDLKIDDSNCPPLIPVPTNRPEFSPENGWKFLDGEEAIKKMTVGKGMKVTLFASEKEWPELAKPVQMQFDAKGRLWVAVWPSYPRWKPSEDRVDKILIFEDSKGTGKADKMTVFADGLNCPTGFEFYNGGILIAQAPDLWFLKDTDGDGKADLRQRVLHGLDSADSHHTSNSFAFDPGGGVYFQEGTFHATQVESPYGPVARCANGGVFRYEPRTQKFDVYVSTGFANPHGHVFDRWGQDIVYDGTGAQPYHATLFSGKVDFPNKHPKPPQVYQQRTRPCPGAEYLSSKHFPDSMQDNLLVGNVITFQGILRYKVDDKDSSFGATELEPIVSSQDPNFRPTDLKVGPDGAIWFIDWHNPIIGHLQHAIRDPNRDRIHGRIYRVTYEGRDLSKSPKIDGEPISALLDLLKLTESRVVSRARSELTGRDTKDVMAALSIWAKNLDTSDKDYEHHLLEALWLHQSHNVVNKELLLKMLTAKDFRARAAATRVLTYWRDRVPEALNLFKQQAADVHPRVRLEAVRAASFFSQPEAIEIVLISNDFPSDIYLDFLRGETLKVLDPIVKEAIKVGKKINFTTDAGARYMLRNLKVDDLLKLGRSRAVCLEILYRPGIADEHRRIALRDLAAIDKQPELKVLLDSISRIDEIASGKGDLAGRDESIVFELVRLMNGRSAADLSAVRPELEKIATTAKKPLIRQVGYVALINGDGAVDKTWALASKSVNGLRDLLNAMPLIADPSLKAKLYPWVEPLLTALPSNLAAQVGTGKGIAGRFVRVEIKGNKKTLSLAEVEVFSNGQNIARKGKASQKDIDFGGSPEKAIDGNTAGLYSMGSISHTKENGNAPWWEVDLGDEYPIDTIVIHNRTDPGMNKRLDGFTVQVLDKARRETWANPSSPGPARKVEFELGGSGPAAMIRRSAMEALTTVRGQEQKTFQTLAKFVKEDNDRFAAIHAMQRIPRPFWPKDDAKVLVDVVMGAIKKIPAKERTTPAALDALEFADALTSLLPPADGRMLRLELGELGVRVLRIHTLPERMAYDKEILVVKAGKPVEFIFENIDLMPHNFVIGTPGSMEELGKIAEATAQSPDAAARHFVPKSPKVLLGSDLLQPRDAQKLSFIAPKEPGVYPYVCTYPGHWMRMHGALYVVEDLDEYQENPEAYLTKKPLTIKDPLLKDRRPRTEWKYEELVAEVNEMKGGRNFGNGKQMFTVATCVACHKMEGVGNAFGADLSQYEPKYKPVDMLKDMLEPSSRINEKFETWIIETTAGKKHTGLIVEDKGDVIKLVENPLIKAEPIVIKKSEIEDRKKSTQSIMPKGLLDKLTKDEILDLLAYIYSKGNKNHDLFKADPHH
ncbi:MAG: discoidin domain-containing protein [Planctomycetes bacterium]|nr:discoidin domain-containing protein [Planctomycetota bacterium]